MTKAKPTSEKALVIVESPAKARTINRYLGPTYQVVASMGHVRDLPPNNLGVDLENRFTPVYQTLESKRRVVAQLKRAAAKVGKVYLATDLDREGEAIAWHLVSVLDLDPARTHRVVFNEITQSAIQAAFNAPHHLDMDKVNAQQARRVLDRIVGYQLSPLLQSKIGKGLSAGRVQSVAVRLIVEREREIRSFVPEESWRIFACVATDPSQAPRCAKAWARFLEKVKDPETRPSAKERNRWLSDHQCLYAELIKLGGRDVRLTNASEARALAEVLGFVPEAVEERDLERHADRGLKRVILRGRTERERAPGLSIKEVKHRRATTRPHPPFTTATLQQAASTMLGFTPARTMRLAQQLYEGVDIGHNGGPVGLITYMRTDSTHLSRQSVEAVRALVQEAYGAAYLPEKPNRYAPANRAQEAHEAIRPTDPARRPDALRGSLSRDQFKLYDLVWRRFVACQMTPARWENTTILIAAPTPRGEALFRTTGRRLVFDGFLRVARATEQEDVLLPPIQTGRAVGLLQIDPQQQFTSPPSRYNEAALIKKMEAEGIGRPSTYASVIQTIQDRGYVERVSKRLHPTPRGEIVTQKLIEHFPDVMDVKFTSHMEEELDKIEDAHLDWIRVLSEFYEPFKQALDRAHVEMERPTAEPSDYTCPQCGRNMVYRVGRNGRFLSCSGFPECTVARNIDDKGQPIDQVVAEEPCPVCGKPMVLRSSRRGPFLGCTGYPECTQTMPCDDQGVPLKKVQPEDVKEICDECGSPLVVKFGKGRAFLGCSTYPKCKATRPMPPGVYVEKPPPEEAGVRCDKCGRPMVIRKSRRGPFLSCSGFPRCRNAMPRDKIEHLRELEAAGKIPDPPTEPPSDRAGARNNGRSRSRNVKVDVESLGPPPKGFAWTRTGKPVVETWPEETLTCPDCGREVVLKTGRFGPYYGCAAYPKCSFVANLRGEAKKRAAIEMPAPKKPKPIPTTIPCDECGEPMVVRTGPTGQFLGCSRYPKCRFSKPLPEGTRVEAPAAGDR